MAKKWRKIDDWRAEEVAKDMRYARSAIKVNGCVVRKKDGSVVEVPAHNVAKPLWKQNDGETDKNTHLSREDQIRRQVDLKYGSDPIDELDARLASLNEYISYYYDMPHPAVPSRRLDGSAGGHVIFSFLRISSDGDPILKMVQYDRTSAIVQEAQVKATLNDRLSIFFPDVMDEELFFSQINYSQFVVRPNGRAGKESSLGALYKAFALADRELPLGRVHFSKIINKLKAGYIKAIGEADICLDRHADLKNMAPDIYNSVNKAERRVVQVRNKQYGFVPRHTLPGRDGSAVVEGERICCRIDSVIIVSNTFPCLRKHHDMIRVVVDVMVRDQYSTTPYSVGLEAYYCRQCKRIFMYTAEFERIKALLDEGGVRVFNRFSFDGVEYGYRMKISANGWASESILKEAGYSVGKSSPLRADKRLDILVGLIQRGVPYHSIVSYLNTFINVLGSAYDRDMSHAVRDWQDDLDALHKLYFA